MTQAECIRQAVARLMRRQEKTGPGAQQDLETIAREILVPLSNRDATMVDGKAYGEVYDPETHETQTVEVQLHAPRLVRPYIYGPADVLSLEREILRRAGL